MKELLEKLKEKRCELTDISHVELIDGIDTAIEIVEAHDPWISVDDLLPEIYGEYLTVQEYVFSHDGVVRVCLQVDTYGGSYGDMFDNESIDCKHSAYKIMPKTTHWMPLPEPPKEQI